MSARVSIHPAYLQKAIDAEADIWAYETDIAAWIAKLSKDERTKAILEKIIKQSFGEGVYHGVCLCQDGATLDESIAVSRGLKTQSDPPTTA